MAANELETTNETVEEEVKDDVLDVEVVDSLEEESEVKTETEETEAVNDSDEAVEAKIDEAVSTEDVLSELVETKDTGFTDLHVKRMEELGIENPESYDSESFLCSSTKSMVSEPCSSCRGGCAREDGLPGLLDIEVQAKADYSGEIVRSGYAPTEAIFFVDVKREDGKFIEAVYSGEGEALGWNMLDSDIIASKSAGEMPPVITMVQAEEIAVKEFGGTVVSVETAMFEGYDTYVVEVDTVTGKSYDAYVTLDGEIAGYDEYDLNSDEETEEKVAMPGAAPAAPAAPAAAPTPADDTDKLVGMIETVTDPAKLKAVIDAIGKDVNEVPAALKAVIIKKANELKVPEILPAVWTQAKPETVGDMAPAAPAAMEKSLNVTVDGEVDEEFAAMVAEFKSMTGEIEETEESE